MSLIEVLVALAIMSLAMLALIPMFVLGVKVNASSNQLSVADSLAREKLEELIQFPTTSARLAIPSGQTVADKNNSTMCANDLPRWYNTQSGVTSTATTMPTTAPYPKSWYPHPCIRTYTIEAFTLAGIATETKVSSTMSSESPLDALPLAPPAVSPVPYYAIKRVTVTVQPSGGPFPGLRKTTQTAWVKYRNALPN
ncbi:MAG: hypothetical protein ABIT01_09760 [Thermoanaerobaculia bacterium]